MGVATIRTAEDTLSVPRVGIAAARAAAACGARVSRARPAAGGDHRGHVGHPPLQRRRHAAGRGRGERGQPVRAVLRELRGDGRDLGGQRRPDPGRDPRPADDRAGPHRRPSHGGGGGGGVEPAPHHPHAGGHRRRDGARRVLDHRRDGVLVPHQRPGRTGRPRALPVQGGPGSAAAGVEVLRAAPRRRRRRDHAARPGAGDRQPGLQVRRGRRGRQAADRPGRQRHRLQRPGDPDEPLHVRAGRRLRHHRGHPRPADGGPGDDAGALHRRRRGGGLDAGRHRLPAAPHRHHDRHRRDSRRRRQQPPPLLEPAAIRRGRGRGGPGAARRSRRVAR